MNKKDQNETIVFDTKNGQITVPPEDQERYPIWVTAMKLSHRFVTLAEVPAAAAARASA